MSLWTELHPKRFFLEAWDQIDQRARRERNAHKGKRDWRPLVALCAGALFLTLMEEWGNSGTWRDFALDAIEAEAAGDAWSGTFFTDLRAGDWWVLSGHIYWALWRFLGFFLLPVIAMKIFCRGERVVDQHMSTQGFWDHLPIYLFAFAVVLVCVIAVSYTEGFSTYYPFYRDRNGSGVGCSRSWVDFLTWECFYLLQFFSLEYFFRGWWLRACERQMGSGAIFAMVVPYVMIHFGKEFPEIVGAIFAGVFLGTLALRTRSIWGGFLVHSLVAVSMDVAAMMQTHGMPDQWMP